MPLSVTVWYAQWIQHLKMWALASPSVAYNFSELIEFHAVDTYGKWEEHRNTGNRITCVIGLDSPVRVTQVVMSDQIIRISRYFHANV